MLQFVLGRAGSGKTEYLRKLLSDMSAKEQKLLMIVPEQYSFEAEKAILRMAGPVRASYINVLSFTRLAEMVFRTEGGLAGERLNDGGRRILMNLAIDENADNLKVYRGSAKDGKITDIMITAVNEMKMCGISEDELQAAAEKLSKGTLRNKLIEISMLYRSYNSLVSGVYIDTLDDLSRLSEKLEDVNFFEGYTVAVDSFEGFTAQELSVLEKIMRQAKNVVVALCTDGREQGRTGLFALVNRTRDRLTELAEKNHVQVMKSVVLTEQPRYKNPAILSVERGLYGNERAENPEGVHTYAAANLHDEAAYVAATIRNLVIEREYRYSDFTIVCRNPESYIGALDVELEKRDIPCFISRPERIDAEPLMRFVLGAFECVQRSFATEGLLNMLKTGVAGFSTEEVSALENYAYIWRLKGSEWRSDFTKNPRGFVEEWTASDKREISALNELRARMIKPLERFAAATRGASGESISKAVYRMLEDFGMRENIIEYCKSLEAAGEGSLAEKQVRVWDALMKVLEQMSEAAGDVSGREKYYYLLRDVIRDEDISEIPQVLDEVLFGAPEQVRQSSPKVVFLIGAVQGEFPTIPKASGVFSDFERKLLISEAKLRLSDALENRIIEERYLAYSAASLPSSELYVTYPKSKGTATCEPSELVSSIEEIFAGFKPDTALPVTETANSWRAAFSHMAAEYRQNTEEAASLRELFAGKEEYEDKLAALERAASIEPERISEAGLAGDFFGKEPRVSASQIETFFSCKFRYFCQYGLRARERRTAEVDAMQYGTIMHFLFERVFSVGSDYEEIYKLEDIELLRKIKALIKEYADLTMGGYDTLNGREKYRLNRMARSSALLIRHVCEELLQSQFQPKHFELKLGDLPEFPPLKIPAKTGAATVIGTIDRVDEMGGERGERYVRVVDYKTGKKKFKLVDVLHGLNMQMLVYLAALIQKGLIPAGVLYMPSVTPVVSATKGETEENIKTEAEKKLRMSGVVLEDSEIIQAMEKNAEGKFLPVRITSTGLMTPKESMLSIAELEEVLSYSKRLIGTMVDELHAGEVEAKPNLKNNNACTYCPYAAVCGREYTEKDTQSETLKKDEVLERMREVQNGKKLD